ncbi:MAG: YicC family protein [Bacteroidia bacterium]
MIYSMTGYGKSEKSNEQITVIVEIKSLNSKSGLDINLRMPYFLKSAELEIRNVLGDKLLRGKIDTNIQIDIREGIVLKQYKIETIKNYFLQLKQILDELHLSDDNPYLLAALFRESINASNTSQNNEEELLTEENKNLIIQTVRETCDKVSTFRQKEGEKLEKDILNNIQGIEQLKNKVAEIEPLRKIKVKEKILTSLKENLDMSKINIERLEQEMIYYIEKIDINEEMVRLQSHLNYFLEIMKNGHHAGRKLSFIAQEIGREINTIGSKANDENIQKLVVEMKDNLEKIKEQINNVL